MDCDVLILGAGPAGTVAALELLRLGYRVTLIERSSFPRPQIGEVLTPGVHDLLRRLDVADAVAHLEHRETLEIRRCWRSREAELSPAPYAIVDRAALDFWLLQRVRERGAVCVQPAQAVAFDEHTDGVRVEVRTDTRTEVFRARYLLDARGRRRTRDAVPCAPPLLALWDEVAAELFPAEIRVEALPQCWLWGAPMRSGYRIMAFCAPATPRRCSDGDPSVWFRAQLAESTLFSAAAPAIERHRLRACDASAYRRTLAPAARHLRLGDAAFALDPLSSSGVEKAMRFSLHAAVAVHTALSEPADASLAQEFLAARAHESAAQHAHWTEEAYAAAWPSQRHEFWQARAAASTALTLAPVEADELRLTEHNPTANERLRTLLRCPLELSPHTQFIELPCVIGDRIRRHRAVTHPHLARPVAFIGNLSLDRLLLAITSARDLGQWLSLATLTIPSEQALRIAGWLLRTELVCALEQR